MECLNKDAYSRRKNKNKNDTFCASGVWMVKSLLTPNCLTPSTAFSGDLIEIIN